MAPSPTSAVSSASSRCTATSPGSTSAPSPRSASSPAATPRRRRRRAHEPRRARLPPFHHPRRDGIHAARHGRGHFRGVAHAPTFPDVEVVVHAEPPSRRRGTPGEPSASPARRSRHTPPPCTACSTRTVSPTGSASPQCSPSCAAKRAAAASSATTSGRIPSPCLATPSRCRTGSPRAPIPTRVRARLLGANDAVDRLRLELKLVSSRRVRIDRDAEVRCRACELLLTSLGGLVAMSREGASGMYVNPHGIVHDMITVEGVLDGRVRLEGEPETAHSWFPGFAWTACFCARCDSHLGWRFTPAGNPTTRSDERSGDGGARDGGDETSASSFFGLSRASVVVNTERPYVSWDASDSVRTGIRRRERRRRDGGATQMLEENPPRSNSRWKPTT